MFSEHGLQRSEKGEKMLISRSRFFLSAQFGHACNHEGRKKDIMKTLPGEQIFQSKFNFTSKNPFCIQDGIKKDVFLKYVIS